MNQVVITRMHYQNKDDLVKRIRMYEMGPLRCLLAQEDQDFDIAVLCNKRHEDIIRSIHPRIIPFFSNQESRRWGPFWTLFVKWEDIYGLDKYDIQTNLDSDDLVSPQYTKLIKAAITTPSVVTHVHFQPLLRDYYTGEVKEMKYRYGEVRSDGRVYCSAFHSLYQPDKEDYMFLHQDSHIDFIQYVEKSVILPEGHCWINIHDTNDSSKMEMLEATEEDLKKAKELEKPDIPEQPNRRFYFKRHKSYYGLK